MSKKPIHKFNGGRGATLCKICRKIITEGLTEDLYCDDCGGVKPEYVLTRQDGLVKAGKAATWISWNEDGTGNKLHDQPAIGRSFVLDLNGPFMYTWMTTHVTEIISESDTQIEFKTKNSTYTLNINHEK
jgi:hypothetical protein